MCIILIFNIDEVTVCLYADMNSSVERGRHWIYRENGNRIVGVILDYIRSDILNLLNR